MVDQLAKMVKQGWQIPMTKYRVIPGSDTDQLIERLRMNVPSAIRESERTVAERDRILVDAKTEADRIVEEAQRQALDTVSERGLLDTARMEMQRLVEEGQLDARRRVDEANRYTLSALHDLKEHLDSLTRQVDNGIEIMESQSSDAEAEVRKAPRSESRVSRSVIKREPARGD